MPVTLDDLRRFAVARSLVPPTTLPRVLERMGFVQADPIRAPARAQDLILRHRVLGYRAGDLERRYPELDVEEDFFVNYGFVTRRLQALMHPRANAGVPADCPAPWPAARLRRARRILEFVRERGEVHPREVEDRFSHGTVRNYWGGSSNATTHLMDAMQYRGWLRVVGRHAGVRVYAVREQVPIRLGEKARQERLDALADAIVAIYAPLPARSLAFYLRRLRFAAPQWSGHVTETIRRAKARLSSARVGGVDWYWPPDENPKRAPDSSGVRLLAPFDPVVHDRGRFELLWGWVYRFEAYTPAARRVRGYYALPLLWRERVVGWGNVASVDGALEARFGYAASPSRDRAFRAALDAELDRLRTFLHVAPPRTVSGGRREEPSGPLRSRTRPRRSRRSIRKP